MHLPELPSMRITLALFLTWILLLPCQAQPWFTDVDAQPPKQLVSAEQWGSKPKSLPVDWLQTPSRIVIHHAGVKWKDGADPYTKVRALQSWGQREKNWPDLPYHFLISPDGQVFEGRDPQYQPQSNTKYNMDGVINVQLFGDFEQQRVTEDQLASLSQLLVFLCHNYQIRPNTISTHKDEAPGQTTCPGKSLLKHLPRVLHSVRQGYPRAVHP